MIAIIGLTSMISPWIALALLLPLYALYIFANAQGSGRIFFLLVAVSLFGSTLPVSVPILFWLVALSGVLTPLFVSMKYGSEFEKSLHKQSLAHAGESSIKALLYEAHIPARKIQVTNALADKSPLWKIAKAKGIFLATSQDGYSCDPGTVMAMTQNDLSTHLFVYGDTGGGKTSCILRPLAAWWVTQCNGSGMLVMDGKASLPREMSSLPGFQLIRPGVTQFALIHGLGSEEVVASFANTSPAGIKDYWVSNGSNLLLKALVVLEHACKVLDQTAYLWNLACGLRMVTDINYRASALAAINDSEIFTEELHSSSFLASAMRYFEAGGEWDKLAPDTASGIRSQVEAWINPILSHRDLYQWAIATEGFDPTTVLTGALCGVDVSANEYGQAALAIQALVKARVYRAIRLRKQGWMKPVPGQARQVPVLILSDECQMLIDQSDEIILPIGRSLGLTAVFSSQSFEGIVTRFQQVGGSIEAARAFLAIFRSTIAFKCSPGTVEHIRTTLGSNMRRAPITRDDGIAFGEIADSLIESGTLKPQSSLLQWIARWSSPRQLMSTVWGTILPQQLGGNAGKQADGAMVKKDSNGRVIDGAQVISTGYSMEIAPVLSPGEEAFLNVPFAAIVSVMRGGVIRRDIAQFTPM
ncbi:MAG: hypothetical protein ACXWJZ_16770, partial [Burkholderiaceae bacterium]